MDKEIASLKENNTWTLVPAPRNSAVIPCRWQYKAKRDKEGNVVIFKARFVAKGFKQQHGIDYTETFAPVVRYDSLRSILALAASRDLHLLQIDVQTAFLYGEIDQELFIHQPEGYVTEDSENYVCRLNKGLYGLKQASRLWNKKIHRSLVNLLFTQSEADPCVYIRLSGGDIMILAIWVDDGLFAFSDKSAGQSVIDHLREEYKMKAGPAEHFVGLNINRDRPNKTLHLSSPSYIEKVSSINAPIRASIYWCRYRHRHTLCLLRRRLRRRYGYKTLHFRIRIHVQPGSYYLVQSTPKLRGIIYNGIGVYCGQRQFKRSRLATSFNSTNWSSSKIPH
jgi:hypothetical protein